MAFFNRTYQTDNSFTAVCVTAVVSTKLADSNVNPVIIILNLSVYLYAYVHVW